MEFALVFPIIALVILALVEVALLGKAQLEVVAAAREGARAAAAVVDPSVAVKAARAALGPAGPDATVSVTRPRVVGAIARVTVRLPHRIAGGILGVEVGLQASASMRVER